MSQIAPTGTAAPLPRESFRVDTKNANAVIVKQVVVRYWLRKCN